nr:DnaB-like replicative helicase [Caudoviricetes sp.]
MLIHNNILRTKLADYTEYLCENDTAVNILNTIKRYFSDTTKSLNATLDDFDIILSSEYNAESQELKLWSDVKNINISDKDVVESAVIKYVSSRVKEAFFAKAFTDDKYDLNILEELYKLLSEITSSVNEEQTTEDITLSNIDDCCNSYDNTNTDGVKFFDNRVSDTLSSRQFDCGTVNVIVGAPGRGKTQLILNQSVYVASEGKYCLHLALGDLTKRQLILRLLAIITGKTINQLSLLSPEQFKVFLQKAKSKYSVIFEHLHSRTCLPNVFTGVDLINQIEVLQQKRNVHYTQIVIDYDGNIETSLSSNKKNNASTGTGSSMYYEGADIYNNFVQFAKRNNSVIWMLSQPKIQYWSVEKLPLEALNDSSKKGHIIDFCMSIGKKDLTEDKCTLFISKNRHGLSNKHLYLKSFGDCQRFKPIDNWDDDD